MTPSPEALREARDALQGVQFGELFCTECHSNDEECGCDPDITEQQFEHAAQLVALALDKARREEAMRLADWCSAQQDAHPMECARVTLRWIEGQIRARHGGGG